MIEQQFDCLGEWRKLAREVRGTALHCGHYLPEEQPAELARRLEDFLS